MTTTSESPEEFEAATVNDFPISELWRLPYVDVVPDGNRSVLLGRPYFDSENKDWHLYFEVRKGWVGRIAGGEVIHGTYYAKQPADPTRDVELRLATLITQHLSFPRLIRKLHSLENDIQNCAAVLEKYHLISAVEQEHGYASLLIVTELEYLLTLIRSMYDLLNEIVREIAPILISLDGTQNRVVKKRLPSSFAKVVLRGDRRISGDEIVANTQLPPQLANWYVLEAPAFRVLRDVRDTVIHRGMTLPTVYDIPDRGLAVARDEAVWSKFDLWTEADTIETNLVSLRAVFASFVRHIVGATDRLAAAVGSCVQLPEAIAKDVRVYMRSSASRRLVQLPRMFSMPWERLDSDQNGAGGAST